MIFYILFFELFQLRLLHFVYYTPDWRAGPASVQLPRCRPHRQGRLRRSHHTDTALRPAPQHGRRQSDVHPRIGQRLVRVPRDVPEPDAQLPQQRHLVPFGHRGWLADQDSARQPDDHGGPDGVLLVRNEAAGHIARGVVQERHAAAGPGRSGAPVDCGAGRQPEHCADADVRPGRVCVRGAQHGR